LTRSVLLYNEVCYTKY